MLSTIFAWVVFGQVPTTPVQARPVEPPVPLLEAAYSDEVPAEVVTWPGWKYIHAPALPKLIQGPLKPDSIAGEFAADAMKWKAKIVVLRRIDIEHSFGKTKCFTSASVEKEDTADMTRGLARASLLIKQITKGQVQWSTEVDFEKEAIKGSPSDIQKQLDRMTEARFNRGSFNADDKLYRGPFQQVVYVHNIPGLILKGKNWQAIAVQGAREFQTDRFETQLCELFAQSVLVAQSELWSGLDISRPSEGASKPNFALLTHLGESSPVAGDDSPLDGWRDEFVHSIQSAFQPVAHSAGASFALSITEEKTPILQLTKGKGIWDASWGLHDLPTDTKFVKLTYRSTSGEPFLIISGMGPDARRYNVGGAFRGEGELPEGWISGLPLPLNSWQTTTIAVSDPHLRISTTSYEAHRTSPGKNNPTVVEFSAIEPVAGPSTEELESPPSLTSKSIAHIVAAFGKDELTKEDILLGLQHPSALVRQAAIYRAGAFRDSVLDQATVKGLLDLNPLVGEAALVALQEQNTDTSLAFIRRTARAGLTDRIKGVAIRLVTGSVDSSLNTLYATLSANRNWQTRLAAVESMASAKDESTRKLRLSMLLQPEPEIRARVIELTDVSIKDEASRVLYTAVNDPSDMVRRAAYQKLLQSGEERLEIEGLAVWKDESWAVAFGAAAQGFAKKSLIKGLRHPSPLVRMQALNAMDLTQTLALEDLAPVINDADPRVQFAMIQQVRKRSIKLPDEVKAKLAASPFIIIQRATKAMPLP